MPQLSPDFCPNYAPTMPQLCLNYAPTIFAIFLAFLGELCPNYAPTMLQLCPTQLCPNYTFCPTMARPCPEFCPSYAPTMPQLCPNCVLADYRIVGAFCICATFRSIWILSRTPFGLKSERAEVPGFCTLLWQMWGHAPSPFVNKREPFQIKVEPHFLHLFYLNFSPITGKNFAKNVLSGCETLSLVP